MGTVYKRGKIWWIKYHKNGRQYFESSKSHLKGDAEKFLKQREGDIAKGKTPGIYYDRVTFNELVKDFLADYKINKKKSEWRAKISVDHLKGYFDGMKAVEIDTVQIRGYINARFEEKAKAATINRELSALRRAFHLAMQSGKIDRIPHFPMLREHNIREGFFTHDEFLALRNALPVHLHGLVTIAYRFGLRKGELLNLTWDRVNLKEGVIRLEGKDTKSGKGRTIILDDENKAILQSLSDDRKKLKVITPHVFLNDTGTGPLKDFRGAWEAACTAAELKGRLFHDLRRTAVRNMVRAGISEHVAMSISGHKTRAVFDRYDITSEDDLRAATEKIVNHYETHAANGEGRKVIRGDFTKKERTKKKS